MTSARHYIDEAMKRMQSRPLPESTYRVQFHAGFTFKDATKIIPYLRELGITHLYASPYLKARAGSTHGYDVVDPSQLNPEVGSDDDFEAMTRVLQAHGMSHILDMVPNHAGVGTNENPWWNDVLENGAGSQFGDYFDIDWRPAQRKELDGKVLLPILGQTYGEALESGNLKLAYEKGAFVVCYYERRLPVSPSTYHLIFHENPTARQSEISDFVQSLESSTTVSVEPESIKNRLSSLYEHDATVRGVIETALHRLNGQAGQPQTFDALDRLLGRQHYRLCYWRCASDEINYRRFFDINDLAALRMERKDVFEATHDRVLGLLVHGKVAGLRIDHPDGLLDPREYFDRLQKTFLLGVASQIASEDHLAIDPEELSIASGTWLKDYSIAADRLPLYVTVEKILAAHEQLPSDWPVRGTSGYDFLNQVNGLFVDPESETAMTAIYQNWIGSDRDFAQIGYACKLAILKSSFNSEWHSLAQKLDRIAQQGRHSRDYTLNGLADALAQLIACFPIYRSYIASPAVAAADATMIESATERAIALNPLAHAPIFHFIRDVLLQKEWPADSPRRAAERLHFAQKFQQLSSPVMAKGIEDTAFYQYNRFVSLNEVGGDPARFGVSPDELHAYLAHRQLNWPHALSCLSTHDTKRSEDVRARLNVLSEMPREWADAAGRWREINASLRTRAGRKRAPDANDEYFIYQTLAGAWSADGDGWVSDDFEQRMISYFQKAGREAKVHTRWTDPDLDYEKAVASFVSHILRHTPFLEAFNPFARLIAWHGFLNSLSQTLLRIAAPGVPDTYQGTETLDLSLVDPDNRRPVDYAARRNVLDWQSRLKMGDDGAADTIVSQLLRGARHADVKTWVTWRGLSLRREHPRLFSSGDYLPARVDGSGAQCVFAFARRMKDAWALAAVPRFTTRLIAQSGALPLGPGVWKDTRVLIEGLPDGAPLRNVLTGERLAGQNAGGSSYLAAGDLFKHFPVALWIAEI